MKKQPIILTAVLFLIFSFVTLICIGQEKEFIKHYEAVAMYEAAKDTWTDWYYRDHKFNFNVGSSKDIVHTSYDGKIEIYKFRNVYEFVDDKGRKYQMVSVVNQDGVKCNIQLYNHYSILKIIYSNGDIIQFSNKEGT